MAERTPEPPAWLTLADGERVRLVIAPSTTLVSASLAVGLALLAVMSVGVGFVADLSTGRTVSFATLLFILVLLAVAGGVVETRRYVVTDHRAVVGVGLTDPRVTTVDLDAVDGVRLRQSGLQRRLGVGTVGLVTGEGTALEFHLIDDPERVGRTVRTYAGDDRSAPA
jgi:uncharacterized membrane protein YdbT with pleckstrin-like domain